MGASRSRPPDAHAPGPRRTPFDEAARLLAPHASTRTIETNPLYRALRARVYAKAHEIAVAREAEVIRATLRAGLPRPQAIWAENRVAPPRREPKRCSNCDAVVKRPKVGRCRRCAQVWAQSRGTRERQLAPSEREQNAPRASQGPRLVPRWIDPTLQFGAEPDSRLATYPALTLSPPEDRPMDVGTISEEERIEIHAALKQRVEWLSKKEKDLVGGFISAEHVSERLALYHSRDGTPGLLALFSPQPDLEDALNRKQEQRDANGGQDLFGGGSEVGGGHPVGEVVQGGWTDTWTCLVCGSLCAATVEACDHSETPHAGEPAATRPAPTPVPEQNGDPQPESENGTPPVEGTTDGAVPYVEDRFISDPPPKLSPDAVQELKAAAEGGDPPAPAKRGRRGGKAEPHQEAVA